MATSLTLGGSGLAVPTQPNLQERGGACRDAGIVSLTRSQAETTPPPSQHHSYAIPLTCHEIFREVSQSAECRFIHDIARSLNGTHWLRLLLSRCIFAPRLCTALQTIENLVILRSQRSEIDNAEQPNAMDIFATDDGFCQIIPNRRLSAAAATGTRGSGPSAIYGVPHDLRPRHCSAGILEVTASDWHVLPRDSGLWSGTWSQGLHSVRC